MKGITKDSPGDLSRVKFDDQITMYVIASKDEIHESQLVNDKSLSSMKRDLQTAHRFKNNVILFVKRPEGITF